MKLNILKLLTLLLFSAMVVFSQDADKDEKEKKADELKEKAVTMLRETRTEIGSLRTIENRISFTSDLANLMWFYDAKEGKKMFGEVTADFVEILNRYSAELNAFGGVKDESEFYMRMVSPNAKSKAIGRMSKAVNVRQQIAMAMVTQDAEFGYAFIEQTSKIVTDKEFSKKIEQQNDRMASFIIENLANQDIDKGLKFARVALKKKFSKSMLSLLEKVQAKDQDKAEDFASDIMDKVKSEVRDPIVSSEDSYSTNYSSAIEVLSFGSEKLGEAKEKPNSKSAFSKSSLTSLAESLADVLIKQEDPQRTYYIERAHGLIKEFSPSSANRLKNKFKEQLADGEDAKDGDLKDAIAKIKGDSDRSLNPDEVRKEKEEAEKAALFEKLKKGGLKELPTEEKEKFIAEAQRIIGAFENPTEKIAGLSGLATQVKQLGDQEFASELMDEASLLVTQQPKHYIDYMQVWTLATGYSAVDADKAFPILEQTIFQLNDTLEAFVKVGEFIDVTEELIIDNEVQLGSFGGSMTQGLIGSLRGSDSVFKNLAEADFDKTKSVVNGFSRTEVRILAKLMVMRSVLDDGKNTVSTRAMFSF